MKKFFLCLMSVNILYGMENAVENEAATLIYDQFMAALKNGNDGKALNLLELPELDLNKKMDDYGLTPLEASLFYERWKIAEKILNRDDIYINSSSYSALHFAILTQNGTPDDIVRKLLSFPALDINGYNNEHEAPLHIAARLGNDTALNALLEDKRCRIDILDSKGHTPLYLAFFNKKIESVKILVQHGAQLSAEERQSLLQEIEKLPQNKPTDNLDHSSLKELFTFLIGNKELAYEIS